MKPFIFLRVVVLCLLLAGVLYAISNLDRSAVERAFAALGIEPGAKTSPGLQPSNRRLEPGERRMTICRTRVRAVVWPDGRRVEEKSRGLKMRWVAIEPKAEGAREEELGYLDIEKWFSLHCQVVVSDQNKNDLQRPPQQPPQQSALAPFIQFEFVDGSRKEIEQASPNVFQLTDAASAARVVFFSTDLSEAIRELENLAFGRR